MRFPDFLRKTDFWLPLGLAIVFIRGLLLDVMDVDASQYASISMEMWQTGNWLQVMHRGADYLDKPPLLFWSSALSMGVFGFNNFAYKLPSALAALAGVYAVYRFSKIYYPEKTARRAAYILASSLGFFLIINDIRTDTLLLGCTACAVWQFAEYLQNFRARHFAAAFLFVGLAMLAKGPIGLVAPAFAVGSHLILKKDWQNLFRWQWILGLLLVAAVLAPMCWGLYQQFDLHPEKPLNDRRTSSGLYFFFWEQSFGRVTGENVWANDTSPFYFVHNYLWAFLPWPLLFFGSLFLKLKNLKNLKNSPEYFSIGGFVLTFLALSMSKYKLPHYIFITFPWAAVILATVDFKSKIWRWLHFFTLFLVAALSFLVVGFVFPGAGFWFLCLLVCVFGMSFWLFFGNGLGARFDNFLKVVKPERLPLPVGEGLGVGFENQSDAIFKSGITAAIGLGLALNFWFYPNLLPHQSTARAARIFKEKTDGKAKLAFFERHGHALDFYAGQISEKLETVEKVADFAEKQGGFWLYTTKSGLEKIETAGIVFQVEAEIPHFQVARLNGLFLNPKTRNEALSTTFLLRVSGR